MAPLVHLSYGARKSSDFVMATFPMSAKTDEERLGKSTTESQLSDATSVMRAKFYI